MEAVLKSQRSYSFVYRRYHNYILTLTVMAVNVFLMAVCFDFYYDLNDDTMMHDIMAGIYSGTPDGHNMQTLYPLGALIALGYRICRSMPWYGLFLCLCQFGAFYLAGVRLCEVTGAADIRGGAAGVYGGSGEAFAQGCPGKGHSGIVRKLWVLAVLSLVMWGMCLPHLVQIQYTITCTMLSAAAVFLFLTTPPGLGTGQFVIKNIPSVILVVLAYQLRTEMLLLTFPIICLAGLYRLTEEKRIFGKENLLRYGSVLGMILAGMVLSYVADCAAYGSPAWKDFREFFDARTTVYDFYRELVEDESYGVGLAEIGVEPHQQTLLHNYNFGLDDAIDTKLLKRMADYAVDEIGASKDWRAIWDRQLRFYLYRTCHAGDAPYNMMVLWAYAAVLVTGMISCRHPQEKSETTRGLCGRYAFLWQLVLLAAVRSGLWMFILLRERDPERITHSLYLAEFALLSAMLLRHRGVCRRAAAAVAFALLAVSALTNVIPGLQENQRQREQVNKSWYEIDAYCREQEDSFYFEDVYSTVAFSQRMFDRRDHGFANYDIMGGWMCKSPLYLEKLAQRGIDSAQNALLQEDVYLIMSDEEAADRGLGWLTAFYEAQGTAVAVEQADRVNDSYAVYKVVRQ